MLVATSQALGDGELPLGARSIAPCKCGKAG
jgi:hypothetical protein